MAGYQPLKIIGNSSGLVQKREKFLLPDDAYPTLKNAYLYYESIRRKNGTELLGRLQRNIGTTDALGDAVIVIVPNIILPGVASFKVGTDIFFDNSAAAVNPVNLVTNGSGSATLDKVTGTLTITGSIASTAIQYFPGLPVMGIRTRELPNASIDETIWFDLHYAYRYNSFTSQFEEFIAGETWNAAAPAITSTNFIWSTNYWVSATPMFSTANAKLFWVTNNSGSQGATADPPKITDGVSWVAFDSGAWHQIDATEYLWNWALMLPFRGRMVVFNTWEGVSKASAQPHSNRIRWSTIGNPFIPYAAGPPDTGSWRDDIRGQGGFLDIPTSQDIICIGFVRDNLVIYCENSTWQLRYTGRSIAPFQIERVNSELGAQSPFSAVQFDTSLLGVGDKGVVECDSYKSEKIDAKIPDLVFTFNTSNNGVFRVHGVRDFINRLAYWTFPGTTAEQDTSALTVFPTQRLVYNYENDSWAIFRDSYTCLGTYQPRNGRNWLNTPSPWIELHFPWIGADKSEIPLIVGGNQQGFVHVIAGLSTFTNNDPSLFITNIIGHDTNPTVVTSPSHNMQSGFVIEIKGILSGTDFENLNNGVFGIVVINENEFSLFKYDAIETLNFSLPQEDSNTKVYLGGGVIQIRDNFNITSKKFNFLDDGENIVLGYLDILMTATGQDHPGAISLNVFLDYNDNEAVNTYPQNNIDILSDTTKGDPFFNTVIPTTPSALSSVGGSKFWQRVYCPTRGNFLTLQYTLSNAQMAGEEQDKNVEIDAQVLWLRRGGRMTQI